MSDNLPQFETTLPLQLLLPSGLDRQASLWLSGVVFSPSTASLTPPLCSALRPKGASELTGIKGAKRLRERLNECEKGGQGSAVLVHQLLSRTVSLSPCELMDVCKHAPGAAPLWPR